MATKYEVVRSLFYHPSLVLKGASAVLDLHFTNQTHMSDTPFFSIGLNQAERIHLIHPKLYPECLIEMHVIWLCAMCLGVVG